jgi:hypothetical protein
LITDRTIRDSIPYDERERPAYDLLCEARELLGRAHDKIVQATDYHGEHNIILVGLCPQINDLIETLHSACAVAPRTP